MNKQLSRMSGDSCNRQTSCPSRRARRAALTLCLLLLPQIGHAFLFPEHRDISCASDRGTQPGAARSVRQALVRGPHRT